LGKITILGRLKSCDIPIKDHKASRTNTKIRLEGGAFLVEDLGSSNGTFLNGEKIQRANLAHGDRVKIGKTVFRFDNPQPAARRAAPRKPSPPTPAPAPPPRPKPPEPSSPLAPEAMAAMETPPAGTPPPSAPAVEEAEEEVEEIDLGGEDLGTDQDPYPAPRPAPAPAAPTPKPKPAYVARVPLAAPKAGGRKPRTLLLEDISQRSGSFRALVYIGVIALMGFLAYLAFHLASSAF
jgi:hypothetical protein